MRFCPLRQLLVETKYYKNNKKDFDDMKKILSFLLLTLMTVMLFSASVLADEEKLEMEGMEGLETEEVKVALAEDLDGFARGFTAAWDLEPPAELLK